MSEETEVVKLPEEIDFNQPVMDWNNKPIEESYFEEEFEEEGAILEQKLAIAGKLNDVDMERLIVLKKRRPTKLGNYCLNALGREIEGDNALDGGQRFKLFKLASLIQGEAGEDEWAVVRLSNTKKKLLLERVEKVYPTLIYSRIRLALNWRVDEDGLEDED